MEKSLQCLCDVPATWGHQKQVVPSSAWEAATQGAEQQGDPERLPWLGLEARKVSTELSPAGGDCPHGAERVLAAGTSPAPPALGWGA